MQSGVGRATHGTKSEFAIPATGSRSRQRQFQSRVYEQDDEQVCARGSRTGGARSREGPEAATAIAAKIGCLAYMLIDWGEGRGERWHADRGPTDEAERLKALERWNSTARSSADFVLSSP